ncbi:MAG: thiaminase II [Alphaproteobacteria bacterium]|jgi:thiaminase/transcriptional activator TenA|nr:thiaminase II [Candidatus Jidaibacter sp.]
MKKLSQVALTKCASIIQPIKDHPFNTELASGTLDLDKFAYYIEQDTVYLRYFARSLSMIASKAPLKFMQNFLSFSECALIAEQEVVHTFFRDTLNLQPTNKLTTATLAYTSFLLQSGILEPVEVAVAAVLPCFWVYNIVGKHIAQSSDIKIQNPYNRWIETYASPEFTESVERAISIFDELALSSSDQVCELMLDAFYKSTVLEWHFWNDAYNQEAFDIIY